MRFHLPASARVELTVGAHERAQQLDEERPQVDRLAVHFAVSTRPSRPASLVVSIVPLTPRFHLRARVAHGRPREQERCHSDDRDEGRT